MSNEAINPASCKTAVSGSGLVSQGYQLINKVKMQAEELGQ